MCAGKIAQGVGVREVVDGLHMGTVTLADAGFAGWVDMCDGSVLACWNEACWITSQNEVAEGRCAFACFRDASF